MGKINLLCLHHAHQCALCSFGPCSRPDHCHGVSGRHRQWFGQRSCVCWLACTRLPTFLFAVAVPMTATVAANEARADRIGLFPGSGSGVLGFGVVWSWYRRDWLSVVATVFGLLVCHECFKANRLALGPFWTTSVTSIWLILR